MEKDNSEKLINTNYISKISQNNSFNLSDEEINFIYIFYKTNSLLMTKNYLDLSLEDSIKYYKDPNIQNIIRALKLEKNKQIFKQKMLSLEELGSYLSNLIVDNEVADSDKFSQKDKIEASKLLIDIHKTISGSMDNPNIIMNDYKILDVNFENKSIKDLRQLLYNKEDFNNSNNLIPNEENEKLVDNYNKIKVEKTKIENEKELKKAQKILNEKE